MSLNFDDFYVWSREKLNLQLDGYKERQLQRRIATIMRKSGMQDLGSYAELITIDPLIKKEFLDYITINVTDFYRNPEIFSEFEELLIQTVAKRFPSLKIWSAACSTGAEIYSIAMVLQQNRMTNRSTLIGTDIDETILDKARKGIYAEHEIKNLKEEELETFFALKGRHYHLREDIKKMVVFHKQDLILDSYEKGFQVIVCRNVTIYFKDEIKNAIYQKLSQSLVSGGILFIGATETIYRPEVYQLKKIGSFLYEKM